MSRGTPKGLGDRILGLFTDVRRGESVTALLLMLNMFVLLAAYYLCKTIREPLILNARGGAEVKSYAAAATAGLLMILVPLYSAVAARVSRVKLINGVTLFFIACLLAFFGLSQAGVPIGVPFFIWVGIFSLMTIAQLWAFATDVSSVDQGKRLFAIVGFGASLGAIVGSLANGGGDRWSDLDLTRSRTASSSSGTSRTTRSGPWFARASPAGRRSGTDTRTTSTKRPRK